MRPPAHELGEAVIRVLLADGYPVFRDGLRRVLTAEPDLEVVGEAVNATELLALATTLGPDVIVCDLGLEPDHRFGVTRSARLRAPNAGVVLLATDDSDDLLFGAVKSGASALALRKAPAEEILAIIRRVGAGEHVIDEDLVSRPHVAARMLREFSSLSDETPQEIQPLIAPLSPREIEVLEQITGGNSNKQIARKLGISEQTVKNHMTSILKKLAVNDRTEAVLYSLRRGWISIEASET
jgi:DNA-binding NarL/FixJ family response regulator